ncbi:MAG: hypothetical protein PVJ57_21530 [Phycisphaerae bacterium]|jgi:hypothetical protein
MSGSPAVVVKKGGALTAFISGVFGTLIVCVICGAGLGFYAMNLADRKVSEFIQSGRTLLDVVPELRESFGMVTDLLNDQRDPAYQQQLEVSAEVVLGRGRFEDRAIVVEVANRGQDIVTYLTARVVLEGTEGTPLDEYRSFVATPISVPEQQWRGPLLPGSVRRFTIPARGVGADRDLVATIEVTDLRTWNEETQRAAEERRAAAKERTESYRRIAAGDRSEAGNQSTRTTTAPADGGE